MIAGHTFPSGNFTLQPHHAALWADAVQAGEIDGVLPSIALLVCFRGAGASISDIMDVLETEPADVLFGEIGLEIDTPFAIGRNYSIETSIVGSERKHGAKLGTFDRVTLRYSLLDSDQRAAEVTQVWMVSRAGS